MNGNIRNTRIGYTAESYSLSTKAAQAAAVEWTRGVTERVRSSVPNVHRINPYFVICGVDVEMHRSNSRLGVWLSIKRIVWGEADTFASFFI